MKFNIGYWTGYGEVPFLQNRGMGTYSLSAKIYCAPMYILYVMAITMTDENFKFIKMMVKRREIG